jgi:kynurenine formamidase
MYTADLPLENYYGTGVVLSIPKPKWGVITPEDLENARPKIEKNDIVIINTGWHHYFGDTTEYFCYSPGLYKEAGEWFVEKGVKAVGVDQQALDHPLATAIGPHGPGPLRPDVCAEYKQETGREVKEDFPLWEPCHKILLGNGIMGWENVGGDLDQVNGMRVTICGFPIKWVGGDGSMVRLVAMVDEGDQ